MTLAKQNLVEFLCFLSQLMRSLHFLRDQVDISAAVILGTFLSYYLSTMKPNLTKFEYERGTYKVAAIVMLEDKVSRTLRLVECYY